MLSHRTELPPELTKNNEPRERSTIKARVPEKIDGTEKRSINCVTRVNIVKVGIFIQVMPGALIERIVAIRLTLPIVSEPQSISRPSAINVSPPPGRNSLELSGA